MSRLSPFAIYALSTLFFFAIQLVAIEPWDILGGLAVAGIVALAGGGSVLMLVTQWRDKR